MTAVPDPVVSPGRSSSAAGRAEARHAATDSGASSRERNGRLATIGGYVSLGAGCFALLLAVLLPLVVYPRVAVLPADPQQQQTLTASGATVLFPDASNPAGATLLHDANVTVSNFVSQSQGVDAGDSVVWDIATQFKVDGKGLANARVERVSLDPHTALPTNCCGDRILTSLEDTSGQALTHSGYITWPFNSQKQSYQVWDTTAQKAKTAKYLDETTREGLKVYRYRAEVPLQNIGTMDLPGGLFGVKDPTVTAQGQYSDISTYWIEPNTGDLIALDDQVVQQYVYEGKILTAFAASLHSTRNEQARLDQDHTGAALLPWLRIRATWVLVPVGLILLAVGLFVGWGRRRRA